MHITQLRNATMVVTFGSHRILVDPMLAPRHALPPLRLLDGVRERNPTVALPSNASEALEGVTHCLITHCQKGHFDHLDRAGKAWLRANQVPVICTPHHAPHLAQRGMNVLPLSSDHEQAHPFLGGTIRTMRCTHGRGAIGLLMEHGVGYLIELPGEPSLYIAGDTVLTPAVKAFVRRHRPDVSVIPAGGAHFDLGQELIMNGEEAIDYVQWHDAIVVANHLEALSHCPVSRAELAEAACRVGVADRLFIPADGETLTFTHPHCAAFQGL